MNGSSQPLTVKLAVEAKDVLTTLTKIVKEMDGLTLVTDKDAASADILVLEIGDDPEKEFETISLLLQTNVIGTLFLTSSKTTPEILLPALKTGAREFFQQPLDTEEVRLAFSKVIESEKNRGKEAGEQREPGSIFSVLGAKGGVGTTTFAVNLAIGLQAREKKKSVALVDMNRVTGEVPLFLDVEANTDWEDIGKNINRLDQAFLHSAMARHKSGLYVLPAPGKRDAEAHLRAGFLFELLLSMRRFFDYIVVDHGMYFDDSSFKIFRESKTVFIVSILSLPCVINVRKIQESIRLSQGEDFVNNLRIVANRFEKRAQIGLTEANKIVGTEITTMIPNNYSISMAAINKGQPLMEFARKSDLAKAYDRIVDTLIENRGAKGEGLFGRWFK